jgi:hypothetical protein
LPTFKKFIQNGVTFSFFWYKFAKYFTKTIKKKQMKKFFAIAFIAATLVACGSNSDNAATTDTTATVAADTTAKADTTAPAADTTATADTAAKK